MPEIPENAKKKKAESTHIEDACTDSSQVKAMNSESAQIGQKKPGDSVVVRSWFIAALCLFFHRRDQKEIDNPADTEEAQGEEVDGA